MLAAELFLRTLAQLGVEYIIANPGTDFPPIAEAYGRCRDEPSALPECLLAVHENTAVSMAHGIYLATGKPAAVMCHTTVGTANAICGIQNASRDNIPIIMLAGRTPVTAGSRHGSRSGPIHWGQEMYDQAGMLREVVKWEYEWRFPDQAVELACRCVEIASAFPQGPVYLTMPREVIAEEIEAPLKVPAALPTPTPPLANEASVAALARLIAASRHPVVVTNAVGRNPAAVQSLVAFAETFNIPVVEHAARYMNFPASHPLHAGYDSREVVGRADLVLAIEAEVPWIPSKVSLPDGTKTVHIGLDPHFHKFPTRGYPADLHVAGNPADILDRVRSVHLAKAAVPAPGEDGRNRNFEPPLALEDDWELTGERASAIVSEFCDEGSVIFNEYPLKRSTCRLDRPGSYFGHSPAGGLGWGAGAAIGYKLASPEKRVFAAIGDGSYIFANPVAVHMAAVQHRAPVIMVVFNNARYQAVRRSTLGMYPQGAAADEDGMFLSGLENAPDFAEIAKKCGAQSFAVSSVGKLRQALAAACSFSDEGQHSLVNAAIAD